MDYKSSCVFVQIHILSKIFDNHLSLDCMEVLHVFVSYLTLFTLFTSLDACKSYYAKNLTAERKFDKIFLCSKQNLNAADIFQFFYKKIHTACKFFHAHFQYYVQSKFCHRDLFISRIFYCDP